VSSSRKSTPWGPNLRAAGADVHFRDRDRVLGEAREQQPSVARRETEVLGALQPLERRAHRGGRLEQEFHVVRVH
jgi:hypothetical protein